MEYTHSSPLPNFPVEGLMPTEDTQASSFIKKYPHYDGRGTVVAILDTGVDPAAAGMQVNTVGQSKIIDIVDCTNSGDIQLSEEKPIQKGVDEKGTQYRFVIGCRGHKLILDSCWTIPSDKVRTGTKRLFDLTPSELTTRIQNERKEAFMKKHDKLVHKILAEIDKISKTSQGEEISESDKKRKTELQNQLEALKTLKDTYEDYGPEYNVIVFHDGEHYNASVDTTLKNDFTGLPTLKDYKIDNRYAMLDESNLFNFTVKFYDNGKLLSIVTVAGSHGTHVAGITAGYHPEDPSMNGVAPGARIVSLKIGDHRLGSLEVGAGLTRALNSMIENEVDLANMSYGEATTAPNQGFWINLLQRISIQRYNCIFVSSAGNEGPGLSTLGAPGGITEDVIGVGAFVGHQQMNANYFMLKNVKETSYTWSSLGPTYDGVQGVAIYGPGSAVASYPQYTLKKYEMINGTSMSSPNVCGCLALVVSGMKQCQIKVTPYKVKRAVVTTGKNVYDILEAGFIQTEKAWNYLVENRDYADLDISYTSYILSRNNNRGLYYREINESSRLNIEDISVTPKFLSSPHSDSDGKEGERAREVIRRQQFNYDRKLVLIATKSWIK
ncbi:hypothetical protein BB560_007238, partial [Smittium megazygosporum]